MLRDDFSQRTRDISLAKPLHPHCSHLSRACANLDFSFATGSYGMNMSRLVIVEKNDEPHPPARWIVGTL